MLFIKTTFLIFDDLIIILLLERLIYSLCNLTLLLLPANILLVANSDLYPIE